MTTYGEDSADSNYFDSIPEENTQSTQTTQPDFDPNKFVPVEKYQQLEQNFNQIAPKVEYIDKLQQVFNPQTPQYTPEQLAEFQRISQVAQAAINPEIQKIQQQQEVFINQQIDQTAQSMGFADRHEQESWYFEAMRGLSAKANQGDQQAKHITTTLRTLYNNGKFLEMQALAKQNFDYLDQHAGRMKIGKIATQQMGHGFNNSPFRSSNELTPQQFEQQVSELSRAGKFNEARALQEKFAQQIKSMM